MPCAIPIQLWLQGLSSKQEQELFLSQIGDAGQNIDAVDLIGI